MNTFKKKSLYAALAGERAGCDGCRASGVGQSRRPRPGAHLSVLHGSRQGRRCRPVHVAAVGRQLDAVGESGQGPLPGGQELPRSLDFNLYLSKKDGLPRSFRPTGAAVYTPDNSCTTPTVGATLATATEFVPFAYVGSAADGADPSLDRTREGYVEIIEMGDIAGGSNTEDESRTTRRVRLCSDFSTASADTVPGTGGLFGNMTIINVLAGEDFATEATALEGFSQTSLWATPGSVEPTLARVNPRTVVTTGSNTFVTDWSVTANNVDAVSAVLMHDHVYNEFNLETGTKSGTDWVLTMPTKRFYIATGPGNNAGALFQRNFNGNGGSCDDVTVTQYDREERTVSAPGHSRRRRRRRPTRSAGKRTSSRTTTRTCSRRRTAPTFRRRSARAGWTSRSR